MNKMDQEIILSSVILDESTRFTLLEVCQRYHVDKDALQEMLEHGLIEPVEIHEDHLYFDLQALQRIQSALHLQQDLDVNLSGVALILDLRDELEQAQKELLMLRKHLNEHSHE